MTGVQIQSNFSVSLVTFHRIKVNFCVLQAPDRAHTSAYGMGKVRLVWVLLRQNIPGTPVLKHDCVSIRAFQGELLTLPDPSASQGTETAWEKNG